jgi:cob(I)alamin adenosyltransferase
MAIYTRTGDAGTTSLFGGKRVLKCEELVDVYGSIDELNSWVGLIASQIESADVQQFLSAIQSDLFLIGSHLSGWKTELTVLGKRVGEMEVRIDAMEGETGKLRNFILPGGSELGAFTHLARSICRRVERQTVALAQKQKVEGGILIYLNRLSDYFFMLARFINKKKTVKEVIWSGIDRPSKKK